MIIEANNNEMWNIQNLRVPYILGRGILRSLSRNNDQIFEVKCGKADTFCNYSRDILIEKSANRTKIYHCSSNETFVYYEPSMARDRENSFRLRNVQKCSGEFVEKERLYFCKILATTVT